MIETVSKSKLFKGINSGEIIHIFNTNHFQVKEFEPETIIAYSGAKCSYLYLLLSGAVRGEIIDNKGKTIVIDEIKPPDSFAEAFLFSTEGILHVNIVSTEKSKVLLMHKQDFLKLIRSNQMILENYLSMIADRFVLVTRKIKTLSLLSLSAKIANYFLEKEKYSKNGVIKLNFTHQQMADYFGVTRPALSRELNKLEKENVFSINRKEVKIIDRNKMIDLLR
jgi:CRP-like cAMP-binding protein